MKVGKTFEILAHYLNIVSARPKKYEKLGVNKMLILPCYYSILEHKGYHLLMV